MSRLPLFGCAVVLIATACNDSAPRADGTVITGEQLFEDGLGRRDVAEVSYGVRWIHRADTSVVTPDRMAPAPDGGVYVLDLALQQVHRIDDDGLRWSWGRVGDGPREVQNVRAIATDPTTGGVILADSGRQRLLWLTPDGELSHAAPIPMSEAGLIWSIVALTDGSGYVLATSSDDSPVLHVSPDGSKGQRIPPPWEGFSRLRHLQWIGKVFAAPGGRWGYAFESGNGWFVFGSDTVLAFPYVEHADFPTIAVDDRGGMEGTRFVSRPAYSGYDVAAWGDTLYVIPGGRSEHAFRVLDMYLISSGEYLGSRSLPGRRVYRRFAVTDSSLYLRDEWGLVPVFLSFFPKPEETE